MWCADYEYYENDGGRKVYLGFVKRTGSQIDQNRETVDEADIALPREGSKEYRAEYKKVTSLPQNVIINPLR